jgi:hypothetical protein
MFLGKTQITQENNRCVALLPLTPWEREKWTKSWPEEAVFET